MKINKASVLPLLCLCMVASVKADVIAYWQFEPGALTVDSSGNDHTLLNSGTMATSSDSHAANAPGSGSAHFDGGARMYTASNLDLTGVTKLTIEWFMLPQTSNQAFIWSHTYDPLVTSGGMWALLNGGGADTVQTRFTESTGGGTALNAVAPVPGGSANGQWHQYAMTLDASDGSLSAFKLYIDYVEVGTYTSSGNPSMTELVNQVFNIGARQNGAGPFTGYIDEMRISNAILTPDQFLGAVPEPATVALLGLTGLSTLAWHRLNKAGTQSSKLVKD